MIWHHVCSSSVLRFIDFIVHPNPFITCIFVWSNKIPNISKNHIGAGRWLQKKTQARHYIWMSLLWSDHMWAGEKEVKTQRTYWDPSNDGPHARDSLLSNRGIISIIIKGEIFLTTQQRIESARVVSRSEILIVLPKKQFSSRPKRRFP